MKRRAFIGTAMACVVVPAAAKQGVAALMDVASARAYGFFDERFPQARRLSISWGATSRLIGVQSDITPVWSAELEQAIRARTLYLRGVTMESFLFCLKVLASEHARLELESSRLDRHLLVWSVSATPKSLMTGQRHG